MAHDTLARTVVMAPLGSVIMPGLIAASFLTWAAPDDTAEPPEVQASAAIEARDYARAARLFGEAYARDGVPGHIYRQGIALGLAGDAEAAIAAFERFLATDPPEVDAQQAKQEIRKLEPQLADRFVSRGQLRDAAELYAKRFRRDGNPEDVFQEADLRQRDGDCPGAVGAFERYLAAAPGGPHAASAQEGVDACEPEPMPTPTRPPPPRRRPQAISVGLWTSGAILAAAGVGTLIAAPVVANRASDSQTEDLWATRSRRANALAISGSLITAVGGALLVAALVHTLTSRRSSRTRQRAARLGRSLTLTVIR